MTGTVTTTTAAHLAEVSTATIRKWVARGHLTPVGRKGREHVFAAGDVYAVEVATMRRDRTGRAAR